MAQNGVTFPERIASGFDRILSGAAGGQVLVLGGVTFALLVLLAILKSVLTRVGPLSAMWWSLIAFLDPVSFAAAEDTMSAALGILASMLGLVVVASLIGLVSTSLESRLEALKKGRSRVVCSGHALILSSNFSQNKVLQILREMSIAAGARSRHVARTIVILSVEKKSDIEDLVVAQALPHLDVVVRTGAPTSLASLRIAGADRASTIILLNPALDSGASEDSEVLKTLLALRQVVSGDARVVCELAGQDQLVILQTILPCRLDHVVMSETLARLLVQTCRVRGLSEVSTGEQKRLSVGFNVAKRCSRIC